MDPSNFPDPKHTLKTPKPESIELPSLLEAVKSFPSTFREGKSTAIFSRVPASELSRKRRANFSDRLTILQSLMPWKEKMTIVKVLEEAQKYIKFLEAQVTALQSMPVMSFEGFTGGGSGGFGDEMGMLTRQQMLEVCCNSEVFQGFMCRNGCCLFAVEQVLDLKRKVMEVDENGLGLGMYFINDVAASSSSSVINY